MQADKRRGDAAKRVMDEASALRADVLGQFNLQVSTSQIAVECTAIRLQFCAPIQGIVLWGNKPEVGGPLDGVPPFAVASKQLNIKRCAALPWQLPQVALLGLCRPCSVLFVVGAAPRSAAQHHFLPGVGPLPAMPRGLPPEGLVPMYILRAVQLLYKVTQLVTLLGPPPAPPSWGLQLPSAPSRLRRRVRPL